MSFEVAGLRKRDRDHIKTLPQKTHRKKTTNCSLFPIFSSKATIWSPSDLRCSPLPKARGRRPNSVFLYGSYSVYQVRKEIGLRKCGNCGIRLRKTAPSRKRSKSGRKKSSAPELLILHFFPFFLHSIPKLQPAEKPVKDFVSIIHGSPCYGKCDRFPFS